MDRYEQLNGDYMSLAHQIGLLTPNGETLRKDDADYSISAELQSDDVNGIQHEVQRIRETLRPSLQALGSSYRREELDLADRVIEVEDLFDRLGQDVEKQSQNHLHLDLMVKGASEAADGAKKVCRGGADDIPRLIACLESLDGDRYSPCYDCQAGATHLGGLKRQPDRLLSRCA